MSFSFGFVPDESGDNGQPGNGASGVTDQLQQVPARTHSVEELLATLPSKISYNTLDVETPKGSRLRVPRRELFDIRMQLMAEDDMSNTSANLNELGDSDIKTNIYEGGFKTWECSIDLAKLLYDRGPRKDLDDLCRVDHVVEIGCGTSLPTLVLFKYALTNALPLYFTLCDFNASVLQLVTLPNLLLTYVSTLGPTSSPFNPQSPNPLHESDQGDLGITPALISAFLADMKAAQISLTLLSGSWTPVASFLSLLPTSTTLNTVVLASETIYSPTSLEACTELIVEIIKQWKMSKAMVAAKRMYFGVGGGVDEFKEACARRGAVAYEVPNQADYVDEGSGGVKRCLMEVQMM